MYTLHKDGKTCTAEKSQLKVMLAAGWSTSPKTEKVKESPVSVQAPAPVETVVQEQAQPEEAQASSSGIESEGDIPAEELPDPPPRKRRKSTAE